jgi:peptide-methionine (S)-S-oxide reductase
MRFLFSILGMIPVSILLSCAQKSDTQQLASPPIGNDSISFSANKETATFGTGCFWCSEAVFQQLKGVTKVTSGYSGGHVANPSYEQVCTKNTGHAEVVQVVFDPSIITYDELLEVFWKTHDPTTLNRQGNDIGTQYRSVIFYHNEAQKQKAEKYKAELDKSGAWQNPVVTAIEPYKNFYAAENYHQDYYKLNGKEPYCQYVIAPKLEKFEKVFKDKLKGH